ncbi:phycocyanobilin lyase CpcT [Striga asiatica]|uniref:Phycocyanobilin lyase CpcT n=1 Tax=Striga asiatica TaxID=4170 RepID=A0A5A7NZA6_STRAF|nr:phycocyanobilin lyase CpcT [Striga asiatica]
MLFYFPHTGKRALYFNTHQFLYLSKFKNRNLCGGQRADLSDVYKLETWREKFLATFEDSTSAYEGPILPTHHGLCHRPNRCCGRNFISRFHRYRFSEPASLICSTTQVQNVTDVNHFKFWKTKYTQNLYYACDSHGFVGWANPINEDGVRVRDDVSLSDKVGVHRESNKDAI